MKWSPKIELVGSCTIKRLRGWGWGQQQQQKLKGTTSEAGTEYGVLRAAWEGWEEGPVCPVPWGRVSRMVGR